VSWVATEASAQNTVIKNAQAALAAPRDQRCEQHRVLQPRGALGRRACQLNVLANAQHAAAVSGEVALQLAALQGTANVDRDLLDVSAADGGSRPSSR
jgi:hypothetical protein